MDTIQFVPPTSYDEVFAGDFDGDGDTDILAYRVFYSGTLDGKGFFILHTNDPGGTGDRGTFANETLPGTTFRPKLVADFDGDGDDEFVALRGSGAATSLWRYDIESGQHPAGTLIAGILPFPWKSYEADEQIEAVDVDDDGDLDLVFWQGAAAPSGPSTVDLTWVENDGTGGFGAAQPIMVCPEFTNTKFCLFHMGDMDGDDDLDAVVLSWRYNAWNVMDWYENTGGGFAATPVALPIAHHADPVFTISDVDGDDDNDVFSPFHHFTPSRLRQAWFDLLENTDGLGSFTHRFRYSGGNSFDASSITEADFDRDGDADLLLWYGREGAAWLENTGQEFYRFTSHELDVPTYFKNAEAVDLDADGDSDILVGGSGSGSTTVTAWLENPSAQLANGEFEALESLGDGQPTSAQEWSGDGATIVGEENGISPLGGDRMARFDDTGPVPALTTSEQWQILNLRGIASEIPSGNLVIAAAAFFNRVAGNPGTTDTRFRIQLEAFDGAPFVSTLLGINTSEFLSDADPATWELLTTGLTLPASTQSVVLALHANENVQNDNANEFDGHYVDQVTIEIQYCGDGIVGSGESCDDGNLANGDCCSSTCTFESNGSSCDDGELCTTTDVCDGAGICAGAPITCDDLDACTIDACDPDTGLCLPPEPIDPAPPFPGDLLVANPVIGEVLIVDPATGDRRWIVLPGTGSGPVLNDVRSVSYLDDGSIVVVDDDLDAILRIDRASGDRTVLTSDSVGSGPLVGHAKIMAAGLEGTIVLDSTGGLMSIDAATGDRTLIAGSPSLSWDRLAVEANGNVLFITTGYGLPFGCFGSNYCLWRVPADGSSAPVAISGGSPLPIGSGPAFEQSNGLAVEKDGNILVVNNNGSLYRVDPATGDRTRISGGTVGAGFPSPVGSGPNFQLPVAVDVDPTGGIWVTDEGLDAVVFVDPETGDRTVLPDPPDTCGPALSFPTSISVYTGVADIGTSVVGGSVNGGEYVAGGTAFTFAGTGDGIFTGKPASVPIETGASLIEDPATVGFALPGEELQVWDLDFTGSLSGEVLLSLKYDESDLLPGTQEHELTVHHYVPPFGGCANEVDCGWIELPIYDHDVDRNLITVSTSSFSQFVLGGGMSPMGTWTFYGTAAGGSIDFTVGAVFLSVTTTNGQSASAVAAAVAAAINGDPTLSAAGISATANGNVVDTNGAISHSEINDPGVLHFPAVPAVGLGGRVALALLLACVAVRARTRH